MSGQWREIARLRFEGPRFEEHAIEVPALQEVLRFQDLLKSVAKALFRRDRPDAGRLPNHFDEILTLRIPRIEEGSTLVPLEVREVREDATFDFAQPASLASESAELICESIRAASEDRPLPGRFPRSCLPDLVDLGRGLGPEDRLGLKTPLNDEFAVYSPGVRATLEELASGPYEDLVRVTGKVLAADVRAGRFLVYPPSRQAVSVQFDEAREDLVLRALQGHRSAVLRVEGKGRYGTDGRLKQITGVTEMRLEQNGREDSVGATPIWQVLCQLGQSLPESEIEQIPADAATRLDEYLYGGRDG